MIATQAGTRSTTTAGGDHLDRLVQRIAAGDKAAFRCLYAFLAIGIWRDAVPMLPHKADARAVTRSTFVEVWHLAGYHVDHSRIGTRAWIAAIAALQVDDRLRAPDLLCHLRGEYDRHVHRELVALLGAGPATIRVSPATFVRVGEIIDSATGGPLVAAGQTTGW